MVICLLSSPPRVSPCSLAPACPIRCVWSAVLRAARWTALSSALQNSAPRRCSAGLCSPERSASPRHMLPTPEPSPVWQRDKYTFAGSSASARIRAIASNARLQINCGYLLMNLCFVCSNMADFYTWHGWTSILFFLIMLQTQKLLCVLFGFHVTDQHKAVHNCEVERKCYIYMF